MSVSTATQYNAINIAGICIGVWRKSR